MNKLIPLILMAGLMPAKAWSQIAPIKTEPVTNITVASAMAGGEIRVGTAVNYKGVVWTTDPLVDPNVNQTGNKVMVQNSTASRFMLKLTGLQPGTTYYCRPFIITPFPDVKFIYGEKVKFRTEPAVTIGLQVWAQNNLNVDVFANDFHTIPEVVDSVMWSSMTTPAWCYYNKDPQNGPVYGKLYNWYAVHDQRGLCPTGWHVPTEEDFNTLANFLGGESVAGGKMKSVSPLWKSTNVGATNSSGFTAMPGGSRHYTGPMSVPGVNASWWTSNDRVINPSEIPVSAWGRQANNNSTALQRVALHKRTGMSVRCIKD